MRTATVGGRGSQLHGAKTRCCNRKAKSGETVLWMLTPPHPKLSFDERRVVLHVDCLWLLCEQAPEGNPVLSKREVAEEIAALRAIAARKAAA